MYDLAMTLIYGALGCLAAAAALSICIGEANAAVESESAEWTRRPEQAEYSIPAAWESQ